MGEQQAWFWSGLRPFTVNRTGTDCQHALNRKQTFPVLDKKQKSDDCFTSVFSNLVVRAVLQPQFTHLDLYGVGRWSYSFYDVECKLQGL